ncbi:DUF7120 family protein [Halobaculum sp. D14]|uniref:DUF7120 family protein n=1 Tax=unclassified Halobaculum TaxID=2640896 RepID=UPI003EBC0133
MPKVEVTLPDQIEGEINRLVEQGEFLNRDQALEDLLTRGVSAYQTTDDSTQEMDETMFNQMTEDQQDPAMQEDDQSDDYTF